MALFKKKITEPDACRVYIDAVLDSVRADWPGIYARLRETHGSGFVVVDETRAYGDLCAAVIAQDMEALPNLFPADQVERLRRWILYMLNSVEYETTNEWNQWLVQEINVFRRAWRETLDPAGGFWIDAHDAMSAIPRVLIRRWLGTRVSEFTVQDTDFVNSLLAWDVMLKLLTLLGFWKRLNEQYKLVPSDPPPDLGR